MSAFLHFCLVSSLNSNNFQSKQTPTPRIEKSELCQLLIPSSPVTSTSSHRCIKDIRKQPQEVGTNTDNAPFLAIRHLQRKSQFNSNNPKMAGKKIITVFGATGGQGGSVADIFLKDPKLNSEWTVRAVTRDVIKDSAKKLKSAGAEVVSVSLVKPISPRNCLLYEHKAQRRCFLAANTVPHRPISMTRQLSSKPWRVLPPCTL